MLLSRLSFLGISIFRVNAAVAGVTVRVKSSAGIPRKAKLRGVQTAALGTHPWRSSCSPPCPVCEGAPGGSAALGAAALGAAVSGAAASEGLVPASSFSAGQPGTLETPGKHRERRQSGSGRLCQGVGCMWGAHLREAGLWDLVLQGALADCWVPSGVPGQVADALV